MTFRSVAGGFLAQTRDNANVDDMDLRVVSKRAPDEREWRDLKFAFRVAKHVKSNAIVYAKDGATAGIGAGQMSRVEFGTDRGDQSGRGGKRRRPAGKPRERIRRRLGCIFSFRRRPPCRRRSGRDGCHSTRRISE